MDTHFYCCEIDVNGQIIRTYHSSFDKAKNYLWDNYLNFCRFFSNKTVVTAAISLNDRWTIDGFGRVYVCFLED